MAASKARGSLLTSDSLPESGGSGELGVLRDLQIPQPGPVGGRLAQFARNWRMVASSDTSVVAWVTEGLTFRWESRKPPLRPKAWFFPVPGDQEKYALLQHEVQQLLVKRAIEVVKDERGFYSLIFLVPKKTGGWRPVFDLSNLNNFLIIPRFKMESALSVQKALVQGKWAVSIDVKDAYLHVPIHHAFRRYLKFAFEGVVYQFRVLPFGVATAPYVFTRIVRAMAAKCRMAGIQFHHYIDDWLVVADSPSQAIEGSGFVLNLAISLGWIPNWEKSHLSPTQTFEYVGVEYDLRRGVALPPGKRVQKTKLAIEEALGRPSITARQCLSIVGLLASMEKQVPFGRCFLRPVQWCLASQWRILTDRLDQTVVLDERARGAMRWWLDPQNLFRGMPLSEYLPDRTFFTDASEIAWGAHMDQLQLSGMWNAQEQTLHINVLELRAVRHAFEQWGPLSPPGTKWLVFTDNSTVVAHVNKQGGTRSRELSLEAECLIRFALKRGLFIRARHLPGRRNVLADALSRPDKVVGTEWSLHPDVFRQICQVWGTPNIDLFATSRNHKLPVFFSPLPESEALAVDAMSQSWDGMYGYAYPPTRFVTEVLHKVARSQCEILLVAPCWPTQAWFPLLLSLLIDVPRVLPIIPRLLKQPGRDIFHASAHVLKLHVWKLSSDPSKRQAFLEQCPSTWLGRTGSPLRERTRLNGGSSYVGVTEGALIRSLPL